MRSSSVDRVSPVDAHTHKSNQVEKVANTTWSCLTKQLNQGLVESISWADSTGLVLSDDEHLFRAANGALAWGARIISYFVSSTTCRHRSLARAHDPGPRSRMTFAATFYVSWTVRPTEDEIALYIGHRGIWDVVVSINSPSTPSLSYLSGSSI